MIQPLEHIGISATIVEIPLLGRGRPTCRRWGNAAPADGDTASSHLAGVTVDLQRRGMSKDQVKWMEHYLFYMKALGLVEPEEERHQWVFHIMVSGHYSEWRTTQDIVPVDHPDDEHQENSTPVTQIAEGTK